MVFVLDRKKKPLMPCTEKRGRLLLERRKAVVHRRFPFTIRLKYRIGGEVQPVRLKLDPGAKVSGIAIVREAADGQHVLHLAELAHKGTLLHKRMQQRAAYRRRRRGANLGYRAKRFNRGKASGWLPPSLRCRVDNCKSWVMRYHRFAPVAALSIEHVRFDVQKLINPEISGVEYQRGELFGYELREYLLEKWGRRCAYCDAECVPLNIDHICSRGSNRVSNLTLACIPCNQRKGAHRVEDFLCDQPERLARILAHAKTSLASAAAVNTTRWVLIEELRATKLAMELSSGGRTKWNRSRWRVPKTHALDAACVGELDALQDWQQPVLRIACTGRGAYQRSRLDAFGFPRGILMRRKQVHGYQSGDMVRAVVLKGVHVGNWIGRVAIRASGSFNLQTAAGVRQGISWRYCRLLQRGDGYHYSIYNRGGASSPCLKAGVSAPKIR
jgi:hypothetical protein